MYYNCNRSSIVNGMVTTDVYSVAKNFLQRQVLEKLCHQTSYVNTWLTTTRKTVPLKSCCMTTKDSMCQYCLHFHNSHPSSAKDCSEILLPSFVPSFPSECTETMVNYNPSEFASYCCNYMHRQHRGARQPTRSKWVVTETVLTDEEDAFEEHFAEERRGRRRLETQCRALQKSKSLGWNTVNGGDHDLHDLQLLSQNDFSQDFVGLGCRTNQTIRFFAMDSAYSDMFMESLGIDTRPEIDKLTMVLYHFKNELIHVMKSRFQPQNIVNFIKNFTVGSLPAFRRAAKDRPSSVELCADQTHICVIEVTSKSFRKIVLNNNKDVLLLYYTPWCGFCLGFSHVFLTLAYQFRSVPSIVFARINCDANDLPWQYMATEYPTLILYPAHSKPDSVLFPPHQPKTLPNLVRFVLRSSSNLLLLDSSLNVCSRDCISTTRNLSAVRMEALFHEMESTSLEMSSALSHRRRLEVEIGEVASTGSERLELLENKLKHVLSLERLLGKKLFELRLRLNSVQYLHGVLQSYTEPHLDTNTLLSIAQHNTMYKSRLKNYELL